MIEPGDIPPDPVAPEALRGIRRQLTKPKRWNGGNWNAFVAALLKSAQAR